MFLYNVSLIVEESIHEDLLQWVRENIVNTADFEIRLLEMLHSPHEGRTFCLQVHAPSEELIESFQQKQIFPLQALIAERYQDKAFLFDSKMKYLDR